MAKRFIDTAFFKDPFVRGLEGAWKGLYVYLFLDCSNGGIWNVETDVAMLRCGIDVDTKSEKILEVFKDKIIPLSGGQKWFIKNYLKVQHNGVLKANNKAHNSAIKELLEFDLLEEIEDGIFELKEGASKGLPSPYGNGKGNSKGKREGKGNSQKGVDFEKMGFLGEARIIWKRQFPDYIWQDDLDNNSIIKTEQSLKTFIRQKKKTKGETNPSAHQPETIALFEKLIKNPPDFFADKMSPPKVQKFINDFISESFGEKKNSKRLTKLQQFKKNYPHVFDKNGGAIDQGFGKRILEGAEVPILKPQAKV